MRFHILNQFDHNNCLIHQPTCSTLYACVKTFDSRIDQNCAQAPLTLPPPPPWGPKQADSTVCPGGVLARTPANGVALIRVPWRWWEGAAVGAALSSKCRLRLMIIFAVSRLRHRSHSCPAHEQGEGATPGVATHPVAPHCSQILSSLAPRSLAPSSLAPIQVGLNAENDFPHGVINKGYQNQTHMQLKLKKRIYFEETRFLVLVEEILIILVIKL